MSVQKEERVEKSEQITVGVVETGGMGDLHAGFLQTEVAKARLAAAACISSLRSGTPQKVAKLDVPALYGVGVAR